jgi:DNA-cytosine methyltransferase
VRPIEGNIESDLRKRDESSGEATRCFNLGDDSPPTAVAGEKMAADAVYDDEGVADREPRVAAAADDAENQRGAEALYGHELSKAKDKVSRWRATQVKEAFRIGELWADITKTLSERELSAFLASECQIPRRDVARYIRLNKTLKSKRDVLVKHGVAVSVLLDLAGQEEAVREEAIRMIEAGRSLQAKDLRGLKRDIGLAQAAMDGKLDESRARDLKNAAARKARGAANAWLASLEALANEVIALSRLDRTTWVSSTAMDRVSKLAESAGKLLVELPAIVGKDFAGRAAPAGAPPGRGSWKNVDTALRRIAQRDVFLEEHYERPTTTMLAFDHDLVWDLAWAFGYDEDDRPETTVTRMREAGRAPLDTHAPSGRVWAEVARKPTVLEICAGAGGQALGLDAAGFQHVGLVEIDNDAVATMQVNRPDWPVIQGDLREVDLGGHKGIDLLAGGVPCQPYSAAGERRGADDERDLFPEALRLVRRLKPRAVMLENVKGVLQVPNSMTRVRILSELTDLGYDAEWRVLEGPDFGLPQNRHRAILVGFRPGIIHRFRWPEPLETEAPTVGEALRDLMGAEGWPHVDAWAKNAKGYAPTLIGGSQKKMGIDLAQEKSRQSWLKIGVNPSGRAKAAPGPDAPADHLPRLTLAMMARIQDFPDAWKFQGSDLQTFRQIANAFPPRMAHAVGASIMRALTGSEVDLSAALAAPRRRALAKGRLDLSVLAPSISMADFVADIDIDIDEMA